MNSGDISKLHHEICDLVRVGHQTDLALAKCLAAMAEDKRYRECGATSMADYSPGSLAALGFPRSLR